MNKNEMILEFVKRNEKKRLVDTISAMVIFLLVNVMILQAFFGLANQKHNELSQTVFWYVVIAMVTYVQYHIQLTVIRHMNHMFNLRKDIILMLASENDIESALDYLKEFDKMFTKGTIFLTRRGEIK